MEEPNERDDLSPLVEDLWWTVEMETLLDRGNR
jgi:hypothetical protein